MALDYVKTTDAILKGIGGADNIASASHCMTRLRLVLKDEGKADDQAVQSIKGVKGVMRQGGQYQIVIGNEVSNLFKEFQTRGNFTGDGGAPAPQAKGSIINRLLGYVSGSMTPLLPAMLGCGMVKVVMSLLTTLGAISTDSTSYIFLNGMGDAFFYFLPILLAYTTAKKLGTSPVVSMVIAAAWLYPDIVNLLGSGTTGTFLGMPCSYFFGLPVIATTYSSSVLPILLMAPIIKVVDNFADRVSPNVVKSFLRPLITILVCDIVGYVVIGPIGGVAGNYLSMGINYLYTHVGWLTIMLLSAFMPFIVMTGMHYALIPLCTMSLATYGYDAILITTMFCSNLAQGGTALAVACKTRDKDLRSEAVASSISAMLAGVTEPTLYGISLRYKTPMIAVVIGGGLAGLFAGITGVVGYSMGGSPSWLTLITMVGGEGFTNLIFGVIAGVISVAVTFVLCFILYKDEKPAQAAPAPVEEAPAVSAGHKPDVSVVEIASPVTGSVVALKDVPDQVFSAGTLGDGVAVEPSVGQVVAPADCEITATMDTKHAVGFTTDTGVEMLVHVGLNTVELNGKYFECKVKEGDKCKAGDVLLTFDMEGIKAAGYPLVTPVIITNSDDFVSLNVAASGPVSAGEKLLTLA